MSLLRRWSPWVLLLLALAGLSGPTLTGPAEESVAPPFSRPLWLDRTSPPTVRLRLDGHDRQAALDWQWGPPAGFSLHASWSLPEGGRGRLLWEGAGQTLLLAELKGPGGTVSLDGRDMAFRLGLGLTPFQSAMERLLPGPGAYTLRYEGDRPLSLDVAAAFPGGRWGLLGTDQRGRDVFRLFLAGINISLLIGLSATFLATLAGTTAGLLSGYLGGIVDGLLMRLADLLLALPVLPILMVLAGLWGRGLWQLVLILSLFSWMGTARTVRALTLSLREAPFVENLRALGAPTAYILGRHLLPEALPVLLATVTLGVPGAILSEAGLAFLGLSDPNLLSWGRMLHEAHGFGAFTAGAWWIIVPPGLGIVVVCLSFLDLGRFLEEKADPRLRERS